MAVLHARGQLKEGEFFRNRSPIGTEFVARIRGTTTVGNYPAVLPSVKGRAWITGFEQVMLDPTDPFPEGFRVSDSWHALRSDDIRDRVVAAHRGTSATTNGASAT